MTATQTRPATYQEAPSNARMEARWARAREKALALVDHVTRPERDRFVVPSQTQEGAFWEVFLVGHPGSVHCTCPAGASGMPCAHAAAIYLWIKAFNAALAAKRKPRKEVALV